MNWSGVRNQPNPPIIGSLEQDAALLGRNQSFPAADVPWSWQGYQANLDRESPRPSFWHLLP